MANENEKKESNWLDYIRSPHSWTIKKYVFEILQNSNVGYTDELDEFLTHVCTNVTTQKDVKKFGDFCVLLYEAGFTKAMKEYEQQLKGRGLKVNIIPEKQTQDDTKPIFNQKNQVENQI